MEWSYEVDRITQCIEAVRLCEQKQNTSLSQVEVHLSIILTHSSNHQEFPKKQQQVCDFIQHYNPENTQKKVWETGHCDSAQ